MQREEGKEGGREGDERGKEEWRIVIKHKDTKPLQDVQ